MTTFRAVHICASLLAAAGMALISGQARAACTLDAECGKGFTCEVVGGTACAGVACPDNGLPCPQPPPCAPQEIRDCVPAACTIDADCADGMACHSQTVSNCVSVGAPTCAPNTDCGAPPPFLNPGCTDSVVSQCVPRYLLGCSVASDCGEGFDCVPEQSCTCAGSAGSSGGMEMGGAGGSAFAAPTPLPLPPSEPSCTCSAGPNLICQPKDLPCSSNASCPASWTCSEVGGASTCSGGAPSSDPKGGAIPPDAPVCTTVPGELKCVPPYYGSVGVGFPGKANTDGVGTGTPGTGVPGSDPVASPTPANTASGPTSAPLLPSAPPNAESMGTESGPGSDSPVVNGRAGCQLGMSAPSGSGLSFLSLLAFAGLLRRRLSRG